MSNISLKYQRFTLSGCQDIGIRTFEFVAKTQILRRFTRNSCFLFSSILKPEFWREFYFSNFYLRLVRVTEIKKTMQENYITFKQNKSNYETLLTSKREWNGKFNNLWSKLIDWFGQVGMSMGLCGEMERSRLQLKPATSPNLVLERYPIVQVATKWGRYFF